MFETDIEQVIRAKGHPHFVDMGVVFEFVSLLLPFFFTIQPTLTAANSNAVYNAQPKRLLTKLIHRDSILSPYYNSNNTVTDSIDKTMKSSVARMAYLYTMNKGAFDDIDTFQLDLSPSSSEPLFLVNFSMGQPPIPQLTVMDTGSSLLWVHCAPCRYCSGQVGPMLDPSKSSTYSSLSCKSSICDHVPNNDCNSFGQCVYNLTYVGGLPSTGVLATEQLIFESSDEGKNIVHNVVFGCSHKNGNYKDKYFTGIFGLGNEITSLVTHMGSKFSYCLGNIADPTYNYNQLVLGSGVNIEGYSTPLEVIDGRYYVTLEGISVGEKRLVIGPGTSNSIPNKRKVIIDSGTAPTWLAENEYKALEEEVCRLLDGFLTPFWRESFLCYKGIVTQNLVGFPVVTFHFAGGADLVLDIGSMFYQALPDVFCMAVWHAGTYGKKFQDFSVIGLMAQQYYNMAYDLSNYKLFFQRIDCELLEEYIYIT